MEAVYSLAPGKIIDSLCTVDNQFITQLANLAVESARNMKVVSFIMKDKAQNRGEVADESIRPEDRSVIDICKLSPLVGAYGSKTLLDEVAHYRANMLRFTDVGPSFAEDNKEMLMVDYLLASGLCYVEVFDGKGHVDKFFATRNRFIAGALAGMSNEETSKYTSYLQAYSVNYQMRQLKVLKLTAKKDGFKISQPRSALDFTKSIKVTPLFAMTSLVAGVDGLLREGILKFKYIKDNLTEREFITTLSPQILLQYYDNDFVQKMMSGTGTFLNRGYIRLPELGTSKYDASGVRALNVSRITSIERVTEFDSRFINVDFDTIMPNFIDTVSDLRDVRFLIMIHEDLTGTPAPTQNAAELRSSLIAFVEGQYAMGTTMALRYIHTYMVSRPQIFTTYNGGKRVEYMNTRSSFDLGVIK